MKSMKHKSSGKRRGFMLMEVVIATGLFAVVSVGFTLALANASRGAAIVASNVQVTRILDSSLSEALSVPVLEEGETIEELEELSMVVTTTYEPIEDLENKDGQLLQDMWRVTVTVNYTVNYSQLERSAVTWRYGRLYQP